MRFKHLLLGIKLAVSAGLLVALWTLIDVSVLQAHLRDAEWGFLWIILLLIPISMGLRALRFLFIINSHRKLLTFWDSFRLALVGETLNIILPASTGDVAKAYYGYRKHSVKEEMLSATVLDKLAGLLGLLILGAVAAALHGYYGFLAFFGFFIVLLGVPLFFPKVVPWSWGNKLLKRMKRSTFDVDRIKQVFVENSTVKYFAVLLSVFAWVVSYIHLYFIARLFALELNPLFLFSVAPLINLSRLFPLSWSGIGVQEGVTAYLFSLAGITPAVSVVISLMFTIMTTVIPGLIGLFFILRLKNKK